MDDKIHFVFNMYDVSHDNTVSKQELTTLLNHIPKEAFAEYHYVKQQVPQPTLNRNTSTGSVSHLASGTSAGNLATATVGDINNSIASDSENTSLAGEHLMDQSGAAAGEAFGADFEEIDYYTNQDVVETAFAECDLNHEGRLTYAEFKMWLERNPSIINYIESILPYNGPKDIEPHHTKAETLPHMKRIQSRAGTARSTLQEVAGEIFNHSSTIAPRRNSVSASGRKPTISASNLEGNSAVPMSPYGGAISRNSSFASSNAPMPQFANHQAGLTRANSPTPPPGPTVPVPPGVSDAQSVVDPEELARMYLMYALDVSNNSSLKSGIQHLLEQDAIMIPRIDSAEVYRTVVSMESYLWKKGKSLFHSLTKRFYLLSGNCMYYYLTPDDVRPKGKRD